MTLVAKRTVEDEVRDERGRWSEAESLVLKYSEDEARDDHGRWTSGSSGAGAASLAASASRGLRTGGFSLHPHRGSAPTSGYQVAMTGHTEQYPIEKVDRKSLTKAFESYLQKHKDILTPGGNRYLGGWVEGGKLWLEPSEHVRSKRDAIALGQKRDQVAVWDNRRKEEIPTGGSGGLDSGALADEIRRTPDMSDEEHNVRKDKEDEQPTRAMEDLVQRRGVRVAADLKPGDVITGKGSDGASRYATIETRLPDEEDYAIFTYRRPSGRLGNMRMLKSNSVSGERDKTKYVGSERPAPKFSGVDPNLRKHAPALCKQIDKAVDLTRQSVSPAMREHLDQLTITSSRTRQTVYAQYHDATIELNDRRLDDTNWTGEFGRIKDTVESGYHPPRNGYGAVTAIMAHEIGHHLASAAAAAATYKHPGLVGGIHATLSTLHELAGGPSASGEAVMGIVGSQLSSYATKNEQEMCAEAWAEYVCASHPRPISRVIGGYMSGTEEGERDANSVLETLGAHRATSPRVSHREVIPLAGIGDITSFDQSFDIGKVEIPSVFSNDTSPKAAAMRAIAADFGAEALTTPKNLQEDVPPPKLYRSVSEDEWKAIQSKGYMLSDQNADKKQAEETGYEFPDYGTSTAAEANVGYLPQSGAGRILQITTKPEHHWSANPDAWSDGAPEYRSHVRVPLSDIKAGRPFVNQQVVTSKFYEPGPVPVVDPSDSFYGWGNKSEVEK